MYYDRASLPRCLKAEVDLGAKARIVIFIADQAGSMQAATREISIPNHDVARRGRCRLFFAELATTFVELGMSPLCWGSSRLLTWLRPLGARMFQHWSIFSD